MDMKTKKWFKILPAFAIAAVVTLSSCQKENGPKTPDVPAPEGYGYFSAAFGTQTPTLTRAEMTPAGTVAENFVDKILVVLYGSDDKVAYRFPYTLTNVGSGGTTLADFSGTGLAQTSGAQPSSDKDKNVVTQGEIITSGNYKMIVILNPTTAMETATALLSNLSSFTEAKNSVAAANFLGSGNDRFVMTNADNVVNITPADLYTMKADAETNPKRVYVDRAVAKITTVKGSAFDTNITNNKTDGSKLYENITDISWYVDVLNTSTYWMRKPTFAKGGAPTPELGVRANYYAEDPNMTAGGTFTSEDLAASSNANLGKQYNLLTDLATAATVYSTENTMNAGVDAVKYGTQVVVKCKIQPIGLALNAPYYSYAGFVFTHEQALAWLYDNDVDIPTDAPANFETVLEDCNFFEEETATAPTSYVVSDNDVTYHFGSWNVYRIPIKHFSGSDASMDEDDWGYYGVVRNNAYTVTITNITGPGSGSGQKYISAYITINPWILRNQNESLGN